MVSGSEHGVVLFNIVYGGTHRMADLLLIRAHNGDGLTWKFVDQTMVGYKIVLDQPPTIAISDGDIWQVELVNTSSVKGKRQKIATVRLVAKVQQLKAWEKIAELPDHWIDPVDLKCILTWLHSGTDIILIGPKGSGKTSLGFVIARTLGWQDPYKVDVYTIKRTTDLFGTDAAHQGSTLFVRSGLLDYIERAQIALESGLDTHFLVILDEINRVHAKVNESLHGLFDDTRQVTVVTTEGSKTIKLPPNLHVVGTMNMGAEYLGVHGLDEALKDRFAPVKVRPMPVDYEVTKLVRETKVLEQQALAVVKVAQALRESATGGQISFAPSYRACRNVARLLNHGLDLKTAIIKGFLGWYEGELALDPRGEVAQPNTEMAKAYSALRMRGVAQAKDLIQVAAREM
ncbi:MAG: hypothetical protein A3G02_02465 [Candidatus Yanofskybacteria bacterium RIFCSPLOWO2_12_FULL_44_13b]|uniref:ATPase dynein-related AAA domain-containing protein n=2 Tax=Candidatus Yanofskyibacteriota TaxID=1752733 RepID=A0A1F8H142_9BACT|nr:MAG: hypothetical protein A3F50_01990 [Candidatus Yanofskybacteria bacterium RIFCSPHIGHO2_12_FULL_44_29b]OGN26447.1 MAG: hypothetical protein A3B12_02875 [Candidatus Yanofskybacteria bacterium RIFCSPLOWO2_01_FULL_44_88]OGN31392.1 MAG: hypothetical protein A3I96_00980 [Candidatus Yanofskybacteria bacterium RIFCSPLOWO2_02_FULL_44_18]OGN34614.1 MAG: hypothetical protein A3G02_02465 [Candidatus Yanofskybacteria bacterium RIFCSPLOWO2_12_FULL_44_13b]